MVNNLTRYKCRYKPLQTRYISKAINNHGFIKFEAITFAVTKLRHGVLDVAGLRS
jgi:putative component of membrane protein insertase Oxa1/YidC/SpoIIIJ protein YidD